MKHFDDLGCMVDDTNLNCFLTAVSSWRPRDRVQNEIANDDSDCEPSVKLDLLAPRLSDMGCSDKERAQQKKAADL